MIRFFHAVGGSDDSGEGGATSSLYETSLAVIQWVELVRGERAVQAPANPLRVEAVRAERLYCLLCCGVRTFDVVYGCQVSGARCQVKRCRMCGKESGG